ncbi:TIR domain-containing protein [uncultured Sphingomonas sp.]|uniref:TIR domain-containing protein n=1 Tax=uncultured Sphingomonas sp. TaxID=158754 RepID=UPI0025F2AF96|nr:TIR domain-containing protein [uncultured Sphingomonas sp.]
MTVPASTPAPRAFVSYSWSSPTHEAWVLSLASRLREDGVDVVLDKWDLKPGHDAIAFMESMVTDPTVTKVIMVCDRTYVAKANAREGGVGTESQIISPEIYRSGSQDKFAAVMTDADEDGRPYIPTYYKGRIYFDFRSGDRFEDAYEQLLRWLVDRPQYVKPKIGSVPEAILSAAPAATATQSKARRAEQAIRESSVSAVAYVREYGDALVPELQALSPDIARGEATDEKVLAAVAAMRPYARQLVEIAGVAGRYSEDARVWEALLAQIERLARLMWRQPDIMSWHPHQFDAFKIIARDVFVSTLAVALDEERFDLATATIDRPWLIRPTEGANRPSTSDFTAFDNHVESLEHRKQRLQLNRISLHADLVHDAHAAGSAPSLESVLQAEFVIFLRSVGQATQGRWYPFPLVYASDRFAPFPLFARAESEAFFARLAPVLCVPDVAEFRRRLTEIEGGDRVSRMFDHQGLPVKYLANADFLGSRR